MSDLDATLMRMKEYSTRSIMGRTVKRLGPNVYFVDGAPTTRSGAVVAIQNSTHADFKRSKTMAYRPDPRSSERRSGDSPPTRTRLEMGPGRPEVASTEMIRRGPLRARNRGDFSSAIVSAAYYAKKRQQTMFVYAGNSYMWAVWRVSATPSDYLNPINNTGNEIFSVSPDLAIMRHKLTR